MFRRATPVLALMLALTPLAQAHDHARMGDDLLADTSPRADRAFQVQWDNDLMGGKGQDQGYTNGMDFMLTAPTTGFDRPVLEGLATLGLGGTDQASVRTVSFGQKMFTPDDIHRYTRTLVVDDRPYAGWLYLGYGRESHESDRVRMSRWDVGLIGPGAGGEKTQDQVHRWLARGRFAGWSNQLDNELTLQWSHERSYRLAETTRDSGRNHVAELGWYASVGTPQTHLGARAQWRWGQEAQSVFSTSQGMTLTTAGADTWVWYGFVDLDARAVAHNSFLDGNLWQGSHRVESASFVGEASVGLAAEKGNWRLGFSRQWQTREFDGQRERPAYGSFTVTRRY